MIIGDDEDVVFCPGTFSVPSGGGSAIVISGDNITVSGPNTVLEGDGVTQNWGIAIMIDDCDYLTLSGLTINNYGFAIRYPTGESTGQNVLIDNVEVNYSYRAHIEIAGDFITLQNSEVHDAVDSGSVALIDCFDCLVDNVTSTNLNATIESNFIISYGDSNTIQNSTVYTRNSNGCNSIWLVDTTNNVIQSNQVDNGFKDGSHFFGECVGNIFRYNTFYTVNGWQYVGWPNEDSHDNEYYGNTFDTGIFMDDGYDNVFCVGNEGNNYINGSTYSGPDPDNGTCP